MQELTVQFTPADGSEQRAITLRIGAPVKGETSWSVLIEMQGFDEPFARPTYGEDWAQALELAAKILPFVLELRVNEAGGGTLNPSFFEREAPPRSEVLQEIEK